MLNFFVIQVYKIVIMIQGLMLKKNMDIKFSLKIKHTICISINRHLGKFMNKFKYFTNTTFNNRNLRIIRLIIK